MGRAARACLSGSLGHGACPTQLAVGTRTMLGGVLKETLREHINKALEPQNGTLGRGCPQPHRGAGGKSPTRGWGCTERDLVAGGSGEGSGDPGPGDKRGDKVPRKKEMETPVWGSFPCGTRIPLLPGGPCRGAELSEKYQVAHLGGTGEALKSPTLHAVISASRWSSGMSLRAIQNQDQERAQKQDAGLLRTEIPQYPTGPPILCSHPSINLSSSPALRKQLSPSSPTTA